MIAGFGTARFLYAISGFALVLLTFFLFWENEPTNPDWMNLKAPSHALAPVDTPDLTLVEHLTHLSTPTYAMRVLLPGTKSYVGLAFICSDASPSGLTITASFGPFPTQAQSLQFAVRTGQGQVLRFGPLFTADASAGFHSPQLTERKDVESFISSALRPSALISNGYISFRNRASVADNQRLRDATHACLKKGTT